MSITKIPCRYMRHLRRYSCTARVNHGPCHQCNRPIQQGQIYIADVEVIDTGFYISKFHNICPDDFWEEEEEIMRQAEVNDRSAEGHGALSAAA